MGKSLIFLSVTTILAFSSTHQIENEFLSKVFDYSFEDKSCIYLLVDNSSSIDFLIYVLTEANLAVIIKNSVLVEENYCQPTGYIFVYENFDKLKLDFNGFLPHRRVLIVFQDALDFQVEPFTTMAYLNGLDIVTIIGEVNAKKDFWYLIVDLIDIKVRSVNDDKVIAEWKLNEEIILNRQQFQLRDWKPVFKESSFKVSVFDCPPYIYYDEKQGVYNGIEKYMIEEITKSWPLEYVIFGKFSWYEVTDSVYQNHSNAGMCSTWQIAAIKVDVDKSFPYSQICATFLVPKPQQLPLSTFILQPFDDKLWLFLIFVLITISLSFNFSAKFYQKYIPAKTKNHYLSFTISLLTSIRIMSSGGLEFTPPSNKTILRFLVILWCISSVLINTSYSAGYTSALSYPRLSKPVNSLKDMVEQNIHWGETNSDTYKTMVNSSNKYVIEISNRFEVVSDLTSRNKKIRKKNYGFSTKISGGEFVSDVNTLDCYGWHNLKVLSECMGYYYIVITLNKNSPFTKIFDKSIKKYMEHGFLIFWYKYTKYKDYKTFKNMPQFFSSYSQDNPKYKDLTLRMLQGVFYGLFLGYLLAVGCFLTEIYWKKYFQRCFK